MLTPVPSGSRNWYYDSPAQNLVLRWDNQAQVLFAPTSADFKGDASLPSLVTFPAGLTPTDVPFQYLCGSLTGEVVTLEQ